MVAYNTLEQALSDVGVTLIDINQHDDQYGKSVMVLIAVSNSQQIQALITAALRRCFTSISELSNNIITSRKKGVKDYQFTGRYRIMLNERVDMATPTNEIVEAPEGDADNEPTVPVEAAPSSAKRKGR